MRHLQACTAASRRVLDDPARLAPLQQRCQDRRFYERW
jgi:hypothetical protein